jgi:metaxin
MASVPTAAAEWEAEARKVLVARKPGFGLPTACPNCLPVLLYLRMANVPFDIHVDTSFPDAGEPSLLPLPYSSHIVRAA